MKIQRLILGTKNTSSSIYDGGKYIYDGGKHTLKIVRDLQNSDAQIKINNLHAINDS
jgi:hypothetical protein